VVNLCNSFIRLIVQFQQHYARTTNVICMSPISHCVVVAWGQQYAEALAI